MNTILLNTIPLDGGKVIVKGGGAQLNNQAKTIEITENGTTEVTHDTGFTGLSKVTINTNVQGAVVAASANDVNFRDYDGTILHSYTKDEFLALSALPNLPTREGLICQEWNWSFEDAQEYVAEYGRLEVGATYITDDGKTRLYIRIAELGRMDVPLYFSQTVANGVTIDWGDGSATETLSGTGNVNTTHHYEDKGDYCITLEVAEGCTIKLGWGSSSYCVMGGNGNNGKVYCNMLQKVELGNGVAIIDNFAFNLCPLASVVIPKGITSIGTRAFGSCYSLASVVIPQGVTIIDGSAFYSCSSLASVAIPKVVTSFGTSVFYNCYSLAGVVIPQGSTSLSEICYNCFYLASVVIPQGIKKIDTNSFRSCYSLASVVIPESVISIGSSSFSSCFGMALYDFRASTSVPTLSNTNAFSNIPSDCKIVVPNKLYSEWIAATNWSTYASQIFKASDVFPSDEPEDEVIEYHFELEMDDIIGSSSGYVEGDYSEAYNKLSAFIINNTNADQDVVEGDVLSQNVNMTVNGDQVIRLRHYAEYNEVEFATDAPAPMGGGWDGNASGYIRAISLGYEKEGGF